MGNMSTENAGDASEEDATSTYKMDEFQVYLIRIMWKYFILTVILNLIFGVSVFGLLYAFGVQLSAVLAIICFFLTFIPELGAIISLALPIPLVLLSPTEQCHKEAAMAAKAKAHEALELVAKVAVNAIQNATVANSTNPGKGTDENAAWTYCISDFGQRIYHVILVTLGMFLIKLLVANVISAYLMGRNPELAGAVQKGGEVTETHGALILFAVVFFAQFWGLVGTIISIPAISVLRLCWTLGTIKEDAYQQEVKKSRSQKQLSVKG